MNGNSGNSEYHVVSVGKKSSKLISDQPFDSGVSDALSLVVYGFKCKRCDGIYYNSRRPRWI